MVANRARGHRVVVVQRKREVGTREAGEETVVQHGRCTPPTLFGGLPDHEERATPAIAMLGHQACGARPGGHVEVVPTRVHHGHHLAGGVLRDDGAGKR